MMTEIFFTLLTVLLPIIGKYAMSRIKETEIGKWVDSFGLDAATQRTYAKFQSEYAKAKAGGITDEEWSYLVEKMQDYWFDEMKTLTEEKFGIDITRFFSSSMLDALREISVKRLKSLGKAAK